jgi:hypothetical protein
VVWLWRLVGGVWTEVVFVGKRGGGLRFRRAEVDRLGYSSLDIVSSGALAKRLEGCSEMVG